jgi:aspartate aminotransferase
MISARARSAKPSATLAMDAKATEMQAAGVDVISFGVGQPDFPTPENIRRAATAAMNAGKTGYTGALGDLALREAIVRKYDRDHRLTYGPKQVAAGSGGKGLLFQLLSVLLDPGDEVLIPVPYWVSYPDQVELLGAKPVFVACDPATFAVDLDDLRGKITPRTKLLIINSPGNPSGAVYDKAALTTIAALAREHDLLILSDEVYERFVYDTPFVSIATVSDDAFRRTIILSAVSKTYAMTGWRLGFCATPQEDIIRALGVLQGTTLGNPSTVSQYAAIEALTGDQSTVEVMRAAFQRRRDLMVQWVTRLDGLRMTVPAGAFYAFTQITRPGLDGATLAARLLDEAHVAVVPGGPFGMPDHVRFSYALGADRLDEGMERVANWFAANG